MSKSNPSLIVFVFCASILAASCAFKTLAMKPGFTRSNKAVRSALDSIVICEDADIYCKKDTTGGQVSEEVDIEIINCSNLPKNDDSSHQFSQTIAAKIKSMIKDVDNYDAYVVKFLTAPSRNSQTDHFFKQNTYVGWRFQSGDL